MLDRRWRRGMVTMAISLAAICGLSACGPAVRNTSGTGTATTLGTPVADTNWNAIVSAAVSGAQISMYKLEVTSTLVQGSLHSTFSAYGAVNNPGKISLAITEGNAQTEFYQQGSTAYSYDNGDWSPSAALSNVDVYPTYESIARQAQQTKIALYQLPKAYVQDEYCNVYQSILPASLFASLAEWPNVSPGDVGKILVTWYVGQTDSVLRQVNTQSVGGIPAVGSVGINSSTLMFDLNKKLAQIQIPKDLIRQLENVGS